MRFLIAYDQNTTVSKVLEKGIARAKQSGGTVFLVHTCHQDVNEEELIEIEKSMVELKSDLFDKDGIECETHILIRGANPGEDVVNYAREKDIDEIVIGIKRKSKLGKLMFGSNAQYIILKSHCPVLCVK